MHMRTVNIIIRNIYAQVNEIIMLNMSYLQTRKLPPKNTIGKTKPEIVGRMEEHVKGNQHYDSRAYGQVLSFWTTGESCSRQIQQKLRYWQFFRTLQDCFGPDAHFCYSCKLCSQIRLSFSSCELSDITQLISLLATSRNIYPVLNPIIHNTFYGKNIIPLYIWEHQSNPSNYFRIIFTIFLSTLILASC